MPHSPCIYAEESLQGGDVDKVQTMIRQVERDIALIEAVWHARASMQLINLGEIQVGRGLVIDLTDDINRLTAALLLLGHWEAVDSGSTC